MSCFVAPVSLSCRIPCRTCRIDVVVTTFRMVYSLRHRTMQQGNLLLFAAVKKTRYPHGMPTEAA